MPASAQITAPPARYGHVAFLDPASVVAERPFMYIFAGRSDSSWLGDLWYLDVYGYSWTKVADIGTTNQQGFPWGQYYICLCHNDDVVYIL